MWWLLIILAIVGVAVALVVSGGSGGGGTTGSGGGGGGGEGGGGGGGITFTQLIDNGGTTASITKGSNTITLDYSSHSNLASAVNFTLDVLDNILTTIPSSYSFTVQLGTFSGGNVIGSQSGSLIRLHDSSSTRVFNTGSRNIKDSILLHEVLHGLGMVSGQYSGSNAALRYQALILAAKSVTIDYGPPVEDSGPVGTINVHFEEGDVVNAVNRTKYIVPNEIMTGALDADNYLTLMTLGVLEDLGFTVDDSDTTNEYVFKDYATLPITDPSSS